MWPISVQRPAGSSGAARRPVAGAAVCFLLMAACSTGGAPAASPTTALVPVSPPPSSFGAPPSATPHPFAGVDAWIAFQTNRGGAERIGLIRPDGSGDHLIATAVPGEQHHPDWSPDGSRIVVTSRTERDVLYVVDPLADTAQVLLPCEDLCVGDDEAAWSPDGTKVAFVRAIGPFINDVPSSCGLFVGDLASGAVLPIGPSRSCFDRETFPHWSRDGSRIAYYRGVYEGDATVSTSLYVFDVANGTEQRLTEPAMFAGDSDWSAGDEWIVFSTHPLQDFQCCEVSNLYRIHPDGTGLEQITQHATSDLRATQPRFTPDGASIVFTAVTPSARALWAMPTDGGEPVFVTTSGLYTHPAWQPRP